MDALEGIEWKKIMFESILLFLLFFSLHKALICVKSHNIEFASLKFYLNFQIKSIN